MQPRPPLMLVHPRMGPPGGGEGVGAWALMALREHYDVTVVCWQAPDREGLNRHFGTDLQPGDYRVHEVASRLNLVLDRLPTPLTFVRLLLLGRACRALAARERFDVFVSTANEFAFPRRGLQYVHYPTLAEERPEVDKRWFHRLPGVTGGYRSAARLLAGAPTSHFTRNLTLVNSDFIGALYRRLTGAPCETLHPPIPGRYRDVPLAQRELALLCIGRISAEKRLERAVEVTRALRDRGHRIGLRIAGSWDCGPQERARYQQLFEQHRGWIELYEGLPREELVDLMQRTRFGLHCMEGEHFGMAVAEMQRAGCLVFAQGAGGPAQILGEEQALLWHDVADAVARIDAVLRDDALCRALEARMQGRRELFTEQRFMDELRQHVERMLAEAQGRPPG